MSMSLTASLESTTVIVPAELFVMEPTSAADGSTFICSSSTGVWFGGFQNCWVGRIVWLDLPVLLAGVGGFSPSQQFAKFLQVLCLLLGEVLLLGPYGRPAVFRFPSVPGVFLGVDERGSAMVLAAR